MRKLKHSQNFIKKKKLIDYLIRKSGINSNDLVLEIGTGTGVITERLCKFAGRVISIEKDKRLFKIVKEKLAGYGNLRLINQDFLDYSLPRLPYKCFANIPFNFTADIVRKLLLGSSLPISAYLFIQIEAVHRFLGVPKSNQIALLLLPLYDSEIIYKFRRDDFHPKPSVKVVLVSFQKRFPPHLNYAQYQFYKDFITFSFNQWNKSVKQTLLGIFSYKQLTRLSKKLSFTLNAKPTDLNYPQWLGLFQFIQSHPNQVKISAFGGYQELHKRRHNRLKAIHRTSVKHTKYFQ